MFLGKILVVVGLLTLSQSIGFTVGVRGGATQCFYERLAYQTKYNIEVEPLQPGKAVLTVTHLHSEDNTQDVTLYERTLDSSELVHDHGMQVRVSKFAPESGNYAFCLHNLVDTPFRSAMKIQHGLELMEFSSLPDKDDKAHLDREIEELERQHESLLESLKQVENAKSTTQEMLNLMSTKTVWFGVMGLATIILVNLGFQCQVKKTLKERKMI